MKFSFLILAAAFAIGCVSAPQTIAAPAPQPPTVVVVNEPSSQIAPVTNAAPVSTALVSTVQASPVLIAQASPGPAPLAGQVSAKPVQMQAASVDPQPSAEEQAVDALTPPAWAITAGTVLIGFIPGLGAILVLILKFAGIAASILSALSLCISAVSAALKGVFNVAGLQSVSSAIDAIEQKIQYVVKYLSMFNVQK